MAPPDDALITSLGRRSVRHELRPCVSGRSVSSISIATYLKGSPLADGSVNAQTPLDERTRACVVHRCETEAEIKVLPADKQLGR